MDYVVLDLEWNQASDSRDARNRLLTFEIIEIGAVKLNSRMEIVDAFEELIRPQVYDTMHHITEKLLSLEMKFRAIALYLLFPLLIMKQIHIQ